MNRVTPPASGRRMPPERAHKRGPTPPARLLAALLALALVAAADPDDPLPIRRVALPAAKLPGELRRLRDGVLTRLPRREFEALVRDAARAANGRGGPPRLVEARYRAGLSDSAALVGTAQWKVLHAGPGPALLRLTGDGGAFNLAVKQPRFENRDAVLTWFPDADGKGRSLALYLDRPGEHTVTLDWSARAEQRPEGLFVDLRLPACPAASLELELPAGREPALADGGPVSGPHPAMAPDRRLWRVAAGGKAQLALLIREPGDRGGPLLAWHKMTQRLSPDGVETASTFTVEALGPDVRELVCEFDPLLRPVDVQAPAIERWDAAGPPGRLTIRLARPLREGVVEVRCVGPLTASLPDDRPAGRPLLVPWSSPAVRLAGTVSRGETLELHLHPDLRLLTWHPGDFRLADSSPEKGSALRRLTLQGGGLATGAAAPRRPGGALQAGGVEFRGKQQMWWRLGDGAELVCQIDYELRQGQLFEMPVRLPDGWEVDSVETTPPDLLRSSSARADKSGPLLVADLRRPLRVGPGESAASLLLRLRRGGPTAGADLPFPDVVPVGSRFREGGLAVDFDEDVFRADVRTDLAANDAAAAGPWGKTTPDYYYPFRGEGPAGTLRLDRRRPRFRARVASDVTLAGGQAALDTRLTLEGEAGLAPFVDIFVAGGDDHPWDWRPARVERLWGRDVAAALAPLGAPPLAAAALAARPGGTSWRLWLERPLAVRQTATLRASTPLPPRDGQRWVVPLVTVPGAARQDGEVTLHLAGGEAVTAERSGLSDAPRGASAWRGYRYAEGVPRLTLEARPRGPGPRGEALVQRARLTSTLTPGGELRHHFRFRLTRWPQRAFPVKLPAGAKLLGAAVAGEWLPGAAGPDADGMLALPVPANSEPTLFEILYVSRVPSRPAWWSRLDAPPPGLPVVPEGLEHRWLLPPDTVPVGDADVTLLPGGAADAGPRSASARLLGLLKLGPALPLPGRRAGRDETRRALIDACAGLCGTRGGVQVPLAALVEELAADSLGAAYPLLIDRAALSRAGLSGGSLLRVRPAFDEADSPQPWDDDQLLLLPAEAGVLLTTREKAQGWPGEAPPRGVEAALARAAERGQDAAGGYVTALEWLGRARPSRPAEWLFRQRDDLAGWTAWAPVAGSPTGSLVVARLDVVSAGGGVVAGLLAGSLLLARRWSPRARSRLLLGWLAAAGLALAWLPSALAPLAWWPLVAGLVVAVPWYLSWAASRPAPPPIPSSRLAAVKTAATAGLLLALAALGGGAEPDPADADEAIVFLVPDGDDPAGAVLARPALLDKLRALARPSRGPAPGAVLVSASYEGKLDGDRAEFAATLQAQVFGDGPASLELPFDEVQLVGDVLLDGARVLPAALPRGGYAVRVSGEGRHKVELRFQVGLTRPGDDEAARQVRFAAPPLVQSQVAFLLPEGATFPRLAVKHGAQRVTGEAEPRRLEAELGAVTSPVQLRWHQEPRPAKPARVEYREAYLWDLRADASLLTALLRYAVRDGAVTSLLVDLPPGLDLRSAQARRPSVDKLLFGEVRSPGDPARLAGWSVRAEGEGRAARLDFPVPVSGEVEVTLELVPSAPWGPSVLLPLPRPRGEPEAKTPSYLAYRRHGVEVTRTNWLRLTGRPAEEFAPFWPDASRPAPASLDYASSFRRDPRQPPELRLAIRPAGPALEAKQEVSLLVGAAQAELTARVDLSAAGKDLSLVEYEIDSPRPVTIASVTGPDVGRWSQSGTRLLVWLERTTGATRLELSGWLPLTPPSDKPPGGAPRLDLPCLRLASPARSLTRLSLRAAPGLVLSRPAVRFMAQERPGEWVYVTKQAAYGGSFVVRPGPPPAAEVLTTARREGREVVFASTVEYRGEGDLRSLGVRLRGWDGDAWLETPAKTETRRREQHRRTAGRRERSWSLELAPAAASPYRMTLRGRLPLDEAGGAVSLPDVVVAGATTRQLVRLDDGLHVESAVGVVPAEAGQSTWRVSDEDWGLRVTPRPEQAAAPVTVLLAEVRSYVADAARWRHEARLWVRHEAPAELRVRLPAGVESARALVEGVPAGAVEGGEAWLSLSGGAGVREVVIEYQFDPRREALERPDLTAPRVEGARAGPLLWTVDVPAGWEVAASGGGTWLGPGPTRRAVVELHRAEVALASGRDPASLGRAARSLGLARLALKTSADPRHPLGPDRLPLSRWLDGLQASLGDAAAPAEPEEAPHQGTPFTWRQDRADGDLSVRLAPASRGEVGDAMAFSAQWLIALLAVLTVTASAVLRAAARWLWPELLLVVALAGWQLAGPTPVVLAAASAGVLGRLVIAGRALRAMTWPARPVAGSSRR